MNKCISSVFVAALLYSNTQLKNNIEQNLLSCILGIIRKDDILLKTLHTICIDNDYSRDILIYNKLGIKIYNWPIFVVRYPGHKKPIIYPIAYANYVFEEVYDAYKKFCISRGKKIPEEKCPDIFICNDKSDTCEDRDICECSNSLEKPSGDCKVIWNISSFPKDKCGKTVYVKKDSLVIFKSSDKSAHDLIQTDCKWKILPNPDIDYRDRSRVCFEESVFFDEIGTYYFKCTCHSKRMRLIVIVRDIEKPVNKEKICKNYSYVRDFPHVCGKDIKDSPLCKTNKI